LAFTFGVAVKILLEVTKVNTSQSYDLYLPLPIPTSISLSISSLFRE